MRVKTVRTQQFFMRADGMNTAAIDEADAAVRMNDEFQHPMWSFELISY